MRSCGGFTARAVVPCGITVWGGVRKSPPESLRRSRIFFLSYLVAISFPIEFDVFTYLLTSVTCSKSYDLLTYLLVGRVKNLVVSHTVSRASECARTH